MQDPKVRAGIAVAVVAVVAVVVAAVFYERIQWAWWDYNAARPLSDEQIAKLDACEDPGWQAVQRVLVQDLDVACGPASTVGWMAGHTVDRRVPWMRSVADNEHEPVRSRVRAAMALLVRHDQDTRELTWLLGDPGLDADLLDWVLQSAEDGTARGDWLDPRWPREHRARTYANSDLRGWNEAARRLGEHRFWPSPGGSWVAGLTADKLEVEPCAPADARCLDQLARSLRTAALERGAYPDAEPTELFPPVRGELTGLWMALHADPVATELGEQALGEAVAWVSADKALAPERIVSLVSGGPHVDGMAAGDPMWALLHRTATPWATVAAAVVLAEAAGVPVRAGAWLDGVAIEVGGTAAGIGPQGEPLALPGPDPETGAAPVLPVDIITRQAAIAAAAAEAFEIALERGERRRASRLAALVRRVDGPAGEALWARLPEAPGPAAEARLGTHMGSLFR